MSFETVFPRELTFSFTLDIYRKIGHRSAGVAE